MIILRNILTIIYLVLCVVVTVLATIQTKDSDGASGTITGSSTSNFYEKNKARTKEGMLKRLTIILAIVLLVYTIGLGVLFAVVK